MIDNIGPASGWTVIFRLDNVICPQEEALLKKIGGELELSGKVTFISRQTDGESSFAVIRVKGITSPLIVPLENLRVAGIGSERPASYSPIRVDDRYLL